MLSTTVDVLAAELCDVAIDTGSMSVAELAHTSTLEPGSARAYVAARTWLRQTLSSYLDVEAGQLCLRPGDDDPAIVYPATDLTTSFDYSDSVALLAVGLRRSVGVAVHSLRTAAAIPAIDDSILDPSEYEIVSRSHDPQRAFHKLSCRKNALTRATGRAGLQGVGLGDPSPIAFEGFEIRDLYLGNDFVAAVAAPAASRLDLTFDMATTEPAEEQSLPLLVAAAG